MAWAIKFKKETFKFLVKQDFDTQARIKSSLNLLLSRLDEGVFPFNEMDIRKLKGKRKGFMRLRTGKIRIIFKIDISIQEIKVFAIDYRGGIYKG